MLKFASWGRLESTHVTVDPQLSQFTCYPKCWTICLNNPRLSAKCKAFVYHSNLIHTSSKWKKSRTLFSYSTTSSFADLCCLIKQCRICVKRIGLQITLLLFQFTHRTIGSQWAIVISSKHKPEIKRGTGHWFDESCHFEYWIKDTVENVAKIFPWREGVFSRCTIRVAKNTLIY